MKRTPIAALCLSVLSMTGCDDIASGFDVKEVKTVRQAMATTEAGEVSVKSWDVLLSHRAICEDTDWTYEKYGDADAVVYSCDFKDYDTQILKTYSHSLLESHLIPVQKEIISLKMELEEIEQQEKQMAALKAALHEMSTNGLADIYSTLADALNVGYVDYEALLKGQRLMRLLPQENPDDALAPAVQTQYLELFNKKLDDIKAVLELHGIDAKSVQALGLYRSAIENSDYLRMKREDRDEYITYDTALLKMRYESVLGDIEYRMKAQHEMESSTPPVVKDLKQKVVFDFTPGAVKPIYCGITYTLNGETSAYTFDDDFKACLRMSTAQTWNDDFTALFNSMLSK